MRNFLLGPNFRNLFFGLLMLAFIPITGYAEEFTQPIKFSHKTHAGVNEVPCEFCHIYARRSNSSGVPPVVLCYSCHSMIKGTTEDQQKEIQKVIEYWESQKPIPWKKIHDVPDFVHFSHKRHIQVGFDCTECHGEVSELEEINMGNMKADLSMGWCMTCHKEEHPAANGKISGLVRVTRGGPVDAEAVKPTPDGMVQGSKDCFTCHK